MLNVQVLADLVCLVWWQLCADGPFSVTSLKQPNEDLHTKAGRKHTYESLYGSRRVNSSLGCNHGSRRALFTDTRFRRGRTSAYTCSSSLQTITLPLNVPSKMIACDVHL
eukprot:2139079-Amphidinium_carterae.1